VLLAAALSSFTSGCTTTSNIPTIAPTSRDIGPPPADLQETAVPAPREGENALLIAARENFARRLNAYTICELRREWQTVRLDFLAGKGSAPKPVECEPPKARTAEQRKLVTKTRASIAAKANAWRLRK
jgi:hypothetical protein